MEKLLFLDSVNYIELFKLKIKRTMDVILLLLLLMQVVSSSMSTTTYYNRTINLGVKLKNLAVYPNYDLLLVVTDNIINSWLSLYDFRGIKWQNIEDLTDSSVYDLSVDPTTNYISLLFLNSSYYLMSPNYQKIDRTAVGLTSQPYSSAYQESYSYIPLLSISSIDASVWDRNHAKLFISGPAFPVGHASFLVNKNGTTIRSFNHDDIEIADVTTDQYNNYHAVGYNATNGNKLLVVDTNGIVQYIGRLIELQGSIVRAVAYLDSGNTLAIAHSSIQGINVSFYQYKPEMMSFKCLKSCPVYTSINSAYISTVYLTGKTDTNDVFVGISDLDSRTTVVALNAWDCMKIDVTSSRNALNGKPLWDARTGSLFITYNGINSVYQFSGNPLPILTVNVSTTTVTSSTRTPSSTYGKTTPIARTTPKESTKTTNTSTNTSGVIPSEMDTTPYHGNTFSEYTSADGSFATIIVNPKTTATSRNMIRSSFSVKPRSFTSTSVGSATTTLSEQQADIVFPDTNIFFFGGTIIGSIVLGILLAFCIIRRNSCKTQRRLESSMSGLLTSTNSLSKSDTGLNEPKKRLEPPRSDSKKVTVTTLTATLEMSKTEPKKPVELGPWKSDSLKKAANSGASTEPKKPIELGPRKADWLKKSPGSGAGTTVDLGSRESDSLKKTTSGASTGVDIGFKLNESVAEPRYSTIPVPARTETGSSADSYLVSDTFPLNPLKKPIDTPFITQQKRQLTEAEPFSQGVTTMSSFTDATTVVPGENLSIPGFLEMNCNDFAVESELAKGGGGSVMIGKMMAANYGVESGAKIVVKRITGK
jgi:hypothetical protein